MGEKSVRFIGVRLSREKRTMRVIRFHDGETVLNKQAAALGQRRLVITETGSTGHELGRMLFISLTVSPRDSLIE